MPMQRNVQQQNAATKAEIRRIAAWCSGAPLKFTWLHALLQSRRINPTQGILVRLSDVPEPDSHFLSGLWLTQSREFWEFEVSISRATSELLEVRRVANITGSVEINDGLPGTGASFGLLACQVLREMTGNRPEQA